MPDRGSTVLVPQGAADNEMVAKRAHLAKERLRKQKASKARNTQRGYRAQWSRIERRDGRPHSGPDFTWVTFATEHGCQVMPAAPEDVANWLVWREGHAQKISTLRTALAAVTFAHKAADHPFDPTDPQIRMVMEGIVRDGVAGADVGEGFADSNVVHAPEQAEPIRAAELADVIRHLMAKGCEGGAGSAIALRDAAILALGYTFALRRSELVGLDLEKRGSGSGVVNITARAIELTLYRGKTIKNAVPQVTSVLRDRARLVIEAIEAWRDAAKIEAGTAIVRHVDRHGNVAVKRLTDQSVNLVIKKRMAEYHKRDGVADATIAGHKYSGHSLRVGFAVTAAENGVDVRRIKNGGRWRSLAMPSHYASQAESARDSAHNTAGVSLDNASVGGE